MERIKCSGAGQQQHPCSCFAIFDMEQIYNNSEYWHTLRAYSIKWMLPNPPFSVSACDRLRIETEMEQETLKLDFLPFIYQAESLYECVCEGCSLFLMVRVYIIFLESVTNWGPWLCDRGNQVHLACVIHEEWELWYGVYYHNKATVQMLNCTSEYISPSAPTFW